MMPMAVHAQNVILEDMVITGSRIHKTTALGSSPVTQIDAEELRFQGVVRVEDMVKNLPQVYSGQNASQSNGATGTATINLRNLGAKRTLVLVNGRRLPSGSPIQGGIGADINQIPGALIERVEVLTGGASATYGSDAVAGVVNFIMADDFEGVALDYQFSQYVHKNDNGRIRQIIEDNSYPAPTGTAADGDINNLSLTVGGNFNGGRGNVTAYATYRNIEAVLQGRRDYSGCALSNDGTACLGSSTIPEGRITDFGVLSGRGLPSFDFKVEGTDFTPWAGTTYNYGPLNYFQRPDKRYTAGVFGHYEIDQDNTAYSEFMFMDDRSVAQIAPSGAFFVTSTLNCDNPLMSDQQRQAICGDYGLGSDDDQVAYLGRRNVEGGPRRHDLHHTSFRGLFGMRGDINAVWRYDTFLQYSKVSMENTYQNDLSITRVKRALNAVPDPVTGEPVCQSAVDGSDTACVFWNVFETGAVTPSMIDYLVLPLSAKGTTDQFIYSGYLAANLGEYGIKLPWADTGVDIVLGGEYREENLKFDPDTGFASGDGAGQGGATPAIRGGYDLKEFFTEASVPIVEEVKFAEMLTLDLGYRYSDYSTDQQTNTYMIASGWTLNDQVKLRGSFQRAVRAANIRELYQPHGFNLFEMDNDPCGGPVTNGLTRPGYSFEQCAQSGVTEAQFGNIAQSPAGQYNYLQGGNPGLKPEAADTLSFGLSLSPTFIEGLTLSFDWYRIEIEKGIGAPNLEATLIDCLNGNASECAKVRRGPGGNLWVGSNINTSGRIIGTIDNLATQKVEGVDLVGDYDFYLGDYGSISINNVMAIVTTMASQQRAGASVDDCNGTWGGRCGTPQPKLRNNLRVTWRTPWSVTASLMWRYIDEVEGISGNLDLEAYDFFDLAGIWKVTENATLRAGMNNVFDKEPPIAGSAAGPSIGSNGNTFPSLYDALGRYWFIGVGLEF